MERIESFINTAVGRSFNPDGAYGLQCKDLADAYAIHLFGSWANTIRPANALDVIERSNPEFFEKFYNKPTDPNWLPKRGDLVIWGPMVGNPYGHIAIVESCDHNGVNVIEQDGFAQVPARRKYYKNYMCGGVLVKGWIRPRAERVIGYQAPAPAMAPTERKLKHDTNAREQANTSSGVFQTLKAGDVINMKGFITNGQNIEGESRWFVTARSGKYMWFGGFEDKSTNGLADMTVHAPAPKPVEQPKAPVQGTPLPVAAEIAQFQPEFDFVSRFVGAATSNQFYGRKNLKDEQGNYLKNIPNLYAEQMQFVEGLKDREHSPIKEITVHNTANTSMEATINEFKRIGSYKSSHLIVSNDEIVQTVKKDNTAFTNGSHESNRSSFTIEFLDNVTDERYVEVLKLVTKALGVEKIGKHRDHSSTACPAKLSNEKFTEILNKVKESMQAPAAPVKESASVKEAPIQESVPAESEEKLIKETIVYTMEDKTNSTNAQNQALNVAKDLTETEVGDQIIKSFSFKTKMTVYILANIGNAIAGVSATAAMFLNLPIERGILFGVIVGYLANYTLVMFGLLKGVKRDK